MEEFSVWSIFWFAYFFGEKESVSGRKLFHAMMAESEPLVGYRVPVNSGDLVTFVTPRKFQLNPSQYASDVARILYNLPASQATDVKQVTSRTLGFHIRFLRKASTTAAWQSNWKLSGAKDTRVVKAEAPAPIRVSPVSVNLEHKTALEVEAKAALASAEQRIAALDHQIQECKSEAEAMLADAQKRVAALRQQVQDSEARVLLLKRARDADAQQLVGAKRAARKATAEVLIAQGMRMLQEE